jgi:hypothetical protein
VEKAKILLVEDNSQDEFLILRALRKVNIANEIDIVRDGQQALDYMFNEGEYADRKDTMPVAVMLDLNLPRVSGLQVLERLRADARTHLVPIVILTSSDEQRDRMRAYQGGCNSFVEKPVDFAKFAEAVGRMGIYWLATNIPPLKPSEILAAESEAE